LLEDRLSANLPKSEQQQQEMHHIRQLPSSCSVYKVGWITSNWYAVNQEASSHASTPHLQ
jgi:hypothetical protein